MAEPAALEHARAEAHVAEPLHRPWVAAVCIAALLAMMVFGILSLPRDEVPLPAIARYAMEIALPRWKITEAVNEVVYGTRGFDTFGETFLLLAAVVSVSTLARGRERRREFVGEEEAAEAEQRESDPDRSGGGGSGSGDGGDGGAGESRGEREARRAEAEEAGEDTAAGSGGAPSDLPGSTREPFAADTDPLGSTAPEHSEAMTVIVRVAARAAAVILAVTSIYLFARGYTPGGGFPGGAALAGVGLLLYASLGYRAVRRVVGPTVMEPVELIGALIVVGIAVTGLFRLGSVMANWIQLAPVQTIASGGLLQAFSATEFLEVFTGLTIVIFAMLGMKHDWTPDKGQPDEGPEDGDRGRDRRPAADAESEPPP